MMIVCPQCGFTFDLHNDEELTREELIVKYNLPDNMCRCPNCIADFLDEEKVEKLVKEHLAWSEKIAEDFEKYISILKESREITKEEEQRLFKEQVVPVSLDVQKEFKKKLEKYGREFWK